MNISEEALKSLKCARCDLHLSVAPITSLGNTFLCGRCSNGGTQVKIYEVLAENFVFPCRYQSFGCQERVKWGSVLTHERDCIRKPHFCAAVPPGICLWRGAIHDMAHHFKQDHPEDVLDKNVIEIDLHENVEQCKLVEIRKRFYIFHVFFNKEQKLLKLNFVQLASVKNETYQLTLYSSDFSKRITLASDCVRTYSSMDHNKIRDENVIDMGVLRFLTKDELTLCCEVVLVGQEGKVNEDLFKLLECPICNENMDSPIYQCKTGHSFCNECVGKLNDCPFCHKELTETRNYALENFVSQVLHECKNKNLGCTYSASLEKIEKHEKTCRFYKCPLETRLACDWNGDYEALVEHCKNHSFLTTENYGLVCNLAADVGGAFRLIQAFGVFFKIGRKYVEEEFLVSIQFVGPDDKAGNFVYEFSLLGVEDSKLSLSMVDACRAFTDDGSTFEDCLKIPHSLLMSFVKNGKVKCNIKISRRAGVLTL